MNPSTSNSLFSLRELSIELSMFAISLSVKPASLRFCFCASDSVKASLSSTRVSPFTSGASSVVSAYLGASSPVGAIASSDAAGVASSTGASVSSVVVSSVVVVSSFAASFVSAVSSVVLSSTA